MKRRNRLFMLAYLTSAMLVFLVLFLYPIVRTTLMSFFNVGSISDSLSKWTFAGLSNYLHLANSALFQQAMLNIFKIWFYGGIITICFALLFSVILTSGVKGKKFWRSAIYLPNTISAVALANMWLQYVYNTQYGMFKKVFTSMGLTSLARINWTSNDMLFTSMLIAYCFSAIGYFMLIVMAGIERIPGDLYESAMLDGASAWKRFTKITFPLIRNVFRTCVMLWTVQAVNFFTWSRMFSRDTSPRTITPVVYMYDSVFGLASGGISEIRVGLGTAVGVAMTLIILLVSVVLNRVFQETEYEY